MKPADVAALLQIAASTVRLWASEYRPYLSASASAGGGQHRNFSDQDLRVLYFVSQQKQAGKPGDEIREAIRQMQLRDFDGLPDVPDRPNVANVPMVPTAAANAALDTERRALLREIDTLQRRVDTLETALSDEQTKAAAKLEALLRELGDVRSALAETQTIVKLYESGRLKPPTEKDI